MRPQFPPIVLISILLTSLPVGSSAFRSPIPLAELTAKADVIVVGVILSVESETLTFEVDQDLVGQVKTPTIEVLKPSVSEMSPRWSPYSPDQKLVLFLRATTRCERTTPRWQILGLVGEGESPLDEDFTYFPGRFLAGFEAARHTLYKTEVFLQRFERKTTLSALIDIRDCVEWPDDPDGDIKLRTPCSAGRLNDLRSKSPLHALLVEQVSSVSLHH